MADTECQCFSEAPKMRASRLLSIMMLLQARGRMSAESLSEELEVSVRTIYRDIDQLSAAGVPVYADVGRNGGFRQRRHQHLRRRLVVHRIILPLCAHSTIRKCRCAQSKAATESTCASKPAAKSR